MSEDQDLAIRQKQAEVCLAYQRIFGVDPKTQRPYNADGAIILADLLKSFRFDLPCFTFHDFKADEYRPGDPLLAAVRDGQRSVKLHIDAKLSAPSLPDGNQTKKPKVKKGPTQ